MGTADATIQLWGRPALSFGVGVPTPQGFRGVFGGSKNGLLFELSGLLVRPGVVRSLLQGRLAVELGGPPVAGVATVVLCFGFGLRLAQWPGWESTSFCGVNSYRHIAPRAACHQLHW